MPTTTIRLMEERDFLRIKPLLGTWTEEELLRNIRCPGTRTWVAHEEEELTGLVLYDLQPDRYELLLVCGLTPHTRATLLEFVQGRARHSTSRKHLRLLVADGEWETLALLQRQGFTLTLLRPEGDVWQAHQDVDATTPGKSHSGEPNQTT